MAALRLYGQARDGLRSGHRQKVVDDYVFFGDYVVGAWAGFSSRATHLANWIRELSPSLLRMLVLWVVTVRSLVSEHFRSQVAIGAAISEADYKAALVERSRLVEAVCEWAAASDAILTPPAPGEAPGRETTGDPRLCARWTLVGAPAISVPAGRCSGGLPLRLQLCAAPGEDRALLGAAAWVERALAANRGKPGLT